MSVDVLRRAASLMRERAAAATPGPWLADVLGSEGYAIREVEGSPRPGSRIHRPVRVARCGYEDWDTDKGNAEHIASWHPAVGLAVADWLDWIAQCREVIDGIAANVRARGREPQGPGRASQMFLDMESRAFAVARAYLGESA